MLEISSLTKSFSSKKVLENIEIRGDSKKFLGLLGPSGCGKSTLLRCLAGFESPEIGHIKVHNRILFDSTSHINLKPEERNLSMVFQDFALWPHMTLKENIAFPLRIRGYSKIDQSKIVEPLIERLELLGMEHRLPHELSGGQRQRVALGRALAQQSEILLLDEPLSSLDASLRASLRVDIRKLQLDLAKLAILVTHDWADVEAMCDEVVILDRGCIVARGTVKELKQKRNESKFLSELIPAS